MSTNGVPIITATSYLKRKLGILDMGLRVIECRTCHKFHIIQLPYDKPVACCGHVMRLTLKLPKPLIIRTIKKGISIQQVIQQRIRKIRQWDWAADLYLELDYDIEGKPKGWAALRGSSSPELKRLKEYFKNDGLVPLIVLTQLTDWHEVQDAPTEPSPSGTSGPTSEDSEPTL